MVALLAGIAFLSPLREPWSNLSYDLLFRVRPNIDVSREDVVIVDMDADSEKALGQQSVQAWNRNLHAQLLKRLASEHADLVGFDVVFGETGSTPSAADEALLAAARQQGRVVFGALQQEKRSPDGKIIGTQLERSFQNSLPATWVGLVEESFGQDRAIRKHFPGTREIHSLAWKAAELTMANPPLEPFAARWINYYGPPDTTIRHISFYRVLSNAVPPGISFSNKVVFVGARTMIGPTAGSGTDVFPTPFGTPMTGVELNATAYLNLRRGDWLVRAPAQAEFWGIALLGWFAGSWFYGRKLNPAILAGLALAAVTLLAAVLLFWQLQFWFPWLFIWGAVIPLGLTVSAFTGQQAAASAGKIEPVAAESMAAAASPVSVPDHTLLRCIGRGAYGEVWLARDAIGSFHAVKLVFRKSFTSDTPFEREFSGMQKYTPISRNHPGWVHVLHVGRNEAQGCFYYVMEAGDDEVTGQEINPDAYHPRSLATEIQSRRRLPTKECLEIGISLADALDYLHGQLLVHRDIKPSNVIFVHGQPKFTDVGLVTEVRNRDRNPSLLGTEGYMAPEGPGTAAADIYSLGKLLYEASTGRDRLAFPELPESMAEGAEPELQHALIAIIRKACERDPALRHSSAAELRDELISLQRG